MPFTYPSIHSYLLWRGDSSLWFVRHKNVIIKIIGQLRSLMTIWEHGLGSNQVDFGGVVIP